MPLPNFPGYYPPILQRQIWVTIDTLDDMGQRSCECYPDSNATKTFTKLNIQSNPNYLRKMITVWTTHGKKIPGKQKVLK